MISKPTVELLNHTQLSMDWNGLAYIYKKDSDNSPSLQYACFHNNISLAWYIVEHDTDVHMDKDALGANPLQSVHHVQLDMINFFADELKCTVNVCDSDDRSPLYLVVEC